MCLGIYVKCNPSISKIFGLLETLQILYTASQNKKILIKLLHIKSEEVSRKTADMLKIRYMIK